MKINRLLTMMIYTLICGEIVTYADDPPVPVNIANTVSNLWISSDFGALASYITNLYTTHSNYVPAILAASFYDAVFQGRLAESSNKLYRIQSAISFSPESYDVLFKNMLSSLRDEVSGEISLHTDMGTTPSQLEANASPSSVRAVSDRLGRDIMILFCAPATNAP